MQKFKAKKHLGQNFLKSEAALRKMIEAGEVAKDDVVLEIGPGKGVLTGRLLERAGQVIAVEKDSELFEFLSEKFAKEIDSRTLVLVHGDILEFEITNYELESYKIIANIPYNITGAILKKFLTAGKQPERMVLMVQQEVAARIMGRPNPSTPFNKAQGKPLRVKESILSISVKAYGEPKMEMKVPKRYFPPPPQVDSTIISIKKISRDFFIKNKLNEEKFWQIVKKGFAHKRKKLSSNLKGEVAENTLETIGDKRAENLSLEEWISTTRA